MRTPERPRNWNEVLELLWKESWDSKASSSSPFVSFRGLPENYGNLLTSLQRLGYPSAKIAASDLIQRERRLLDNFRVYAAQHVNLGPSDWDVLVFRC
jgi:hypothetical protein